MTKNLQGRTDNTIKNHWNSGMRRRRAEFLQKLLKIKQDTSENGFEIVNRIQNEVERDLIMQLIMKNENDEDGNTQMVKGRKGRKPANSNSNNLEIIKKQIKIECKTEENSRNCIQNQNGLALEIQPNNDEKMRENLQKKQFPINLKNSAFSPYHSKNIKDPKINIAYSPEFPAIAELQQTAQKLLSQLLSPMTDNKQNNLFSMIADEAQPLELRENNQIINQKDNQNCADNLCNYITPSKMLNLIASEQKKEKFQGRQKENILIKSPYNAQNKLILQYEQADSFFADIN